MSSKKTNSRVIQSDKEKKFERAAIDASRRVVEIERSKELENERLRKMMEDLKLSLEKERLNVEKERLNAERMRRDLELKEKEQTELKARQEFELKMRQEVELKMQQEQSRQIEEIKRQAKEDAIRDLQREQESDAEGRSSEFQKAKNEIEQNGQEIDPPSEVELFDGPEIGDDEYLAGIRSIVNKNGEKTEIDQGFVDEYGMLMFLIIAFFNKSLNLQDFDILRAAEILAIGMIQSGKTQFIMAATYIYRAMGRSVIVMVENLVAHSSQFRIRWELTLTTFTQFLEMNGVNMQDKHIVDFLQSMKCPIRCESVLAKSEKARGTFMSGFENNDGVYIALYNKSQLDNIYKAIVKVGSTKGKRPAFSMVVDEVDETVMRPSDNSGREVVLGKIKDMCVSFAGTTATVSRIVFNPATKITGENIISIKPPSTHKSYSHTRLFTVPELNVASTDQLAVQVLASIRPHLINIINEPDDYLENGRVKAMEIGLLTFSDLQKHQEAIQQLIVNDLELNRGFVTIVHNSNGLSITFPEGNIPSERQWIKYTDNENKVSKIKMKREGDCYSVDTQISKILSYLKNIKKIDPVSRKRSFMYRNVLFISGKIARRGVSYVDSEFEQHITHRFKLDADDGDDLLQSVGRCWGNFNDARRPILYSTPSILEELAKVYFLHQNVIVEHLIVTEYKDENIYDIIRGISIDKMRKPERNLCKDFSCTIRFTRKIKRVARIPANESYSSSSSSIQFSSMYCILYEKLSDPMKKLYTSIKSSISSNEWISRAKVAEKLCFNDEENHQFRTRITNWITSNTSTKCVSDENMTGLLVGIGSNRIWYIRFN